MSDVSTITINNVTYNFKDAIARARNVPSGGSVGQVLQKATATDYDAEWVSYYGYCETAAGTAAKTVSISGFKLYTGAMVIVKFKNRNSASNPTLNVNGTGAKALYQYGTTRMSTTDASTGWYAGAVMCLVYDGTGWVRAYMYNTTYNLANNTLGNGGFTADSAIYRYQLLFHIDRETVTPLTNADNDTGTSKTMLTNVEFDPLQPIYYYNATTAVLAGELVAGSACYFSMSGINLQYVFNCGDSSYTAHKDLFLKIKQQTNGLFKIASADPLTQTLPSTADGYHYVLLGRTYSAYQTALYINKPVLFHDGTGIRRMEDIDLATTSYPGLMSAADKSKVNSAVTATVVDEVLELSV